MANTLAEYPCSVCSSTSTENRYSIGDFRIVECSSCGLVYVNPRIRTEDIFSLYRNEYFCHDSGIGYENYELIAPLRIKTFEKWYAAIIKYLPADYEAALDIGCAAGYFLGLLKTNGWRYVEGIELDHGMCAALRRRAFNVSELPLEHFVPTRRYHLITLFDVLEHLPDINNDFEKLSSMLDPGGIIALVTPNFKSMQRRLFGKRWFQFKPREHIYYFTPQSLGAIAKKHGFEIVRLAPSGQFADFAFLRDRLTKYKFPFFGASFSFFCTLFGLKNHYWYMDTGSMFAVLRKGM